jgi:hypothetical protein
MYFMHAESIKTVKEAHAAYSSPPPRPFFPIKMSAALKSQTLSSNEEKNKIPGRISYGCMAY